MDGAVPTSPKCARCGDLAGLVCKDCREENLGTGELVGTTRYCSAACQKDDWPRHKEYCVTIREVMEFRKARWLRINVSRSQIPERETSERASSGIRTQEAQPNELHSSDTTTSEGNLTNQTNQTPLQSVDSAHPCVFCETPTTKSCEGCKGAPNATAGLFETTYYCSTRCQTAHWSQHSSSCLASQARRKLCAAGEALQGLYHDYCKAYTMIMLQDGSLNQDLTIIHEEGSVQRTTDAISLLYEIPLNSEEDPAFLGCMVGSLYTREMGIHIKSYLKALHPTSVRLITLSFRTLRRRYIRQDWQAVRDKHQVLHVVLPNGESYALDVSGVQFGLKNAVVPWGEYVEVYGGKVVRWEEF
ncbi:hypothetical protein BDR22DRAFT_824003 [Usnea florida]